MKPIKIVVVLLIHLSLLSCSNASETPTLSPIGSDFPLRQDISFPMNSEIQKMTASKTWAATYSAGKLIGPDIGTGSVNYASGKITAIDLKSKRTIWSIDLPVVVNTNQEFQIIDDTLVFVSTTDQVILINKAGQEHELNLQPNNENIIKIVPAYPQYLYVIRGSERTLEAYDIANNTFLWQTSIERRIVNMFYDTRKNIAYVTTDAYLRAFDNTSGKMLWSNDDESSEGSAFASGILYLSKHKDSLFSSSQTIEISAFDIESQHDVWSTEIPSIPFLNKLTVVDDLLLVSGSGGLVALKRTTGYQVWRTQIQDEFETSPIGFRGVLFIKSPDLKIYAISPNTGEIMGVLQTEQPNKSIRPMYEVLSSVYDLEDGIVFNTRDAVVIYK